jgi:hypothetical protein
MRARDSVLCLSLSQLSSACGPTPADGDSDGGSGDQGAEGGHLLGLDQLAPRRLQVIEGARQLGGPLEHPLLERPG